MTKTSSPGSDKTSKDYFDELLLDDASRRQALLGVAAISALYSAGGAAKDDQSQENIEEVLSSSFNSDEYSASGNTSVRRYVNLFKNNTMAVGVLDVPAGKVDSQNPHILDEFYIVLKGQAKLKADGKEYLAEAGQILFVKAGVEHNFFDVKEDLQTVVVFSTADPKGLPFYMKK